MRVILPRMYMPIGRLTQKGSDGPGYVDHRHPSTPALNKYSDVFCRGDRGWAKHTTDRLSKMSTDSLPAGFPAGSGRGLTSLGVTCVGFDDVTVCNDTKTFLRYVRSLMIQYRFLFGPDHSGVLLEAKGHQSSCGCSECRLRFEVEVDTVQWKRVG